MVTAMVFYKHAMPQMERKGVSIFVSSSLEYFIDRRFNAAVYGFDVYPSKSLFRN